jgi:hypothetical protein
VGMSPEVIAHAFDPFFTTKPTGQGTGLGLSMIYGFVQQSGGYVLLSSDEGHGTMVSIYLPRHFGTAIGREAVEAAARPTHAEAGAVVLLVEDEPAVRMVIVEVLSELGYTMLEAGNGQSGLQIVGSGARIDLLVTDVGLPAAEANLLDRHGGLRRDRDILLFDPVHCYGLSGYLQIVEV